MKDQEKYCEAKQMAWAKAIREIEAEDTGEKVWYNGYDVGFDSRGEEIAELKADIKKLEAGLTEIYDTVARVSVDTHPEVSVGQSWNVEKKTIQGVQDKV